MDNELHEPEFRLKDVLFSPLHHWRVIVIAAVVLAVLLGGLRGGKILLAMGNSAAVDAQASAYEKAMQEYTEKKALLERNLEIATANLEAQQKYISESILMSLDYRNVYEASVSLYVDTGYQIMPGMTYQDPDKSPQILAAYQLALNDSRLYEKVADQAGVDVRYIQELVVVGTEEDHLLTVTIQHSDKEQAEALRASIVWQMDEIQKSIASSIGEHDLQVFAYSSGYTVDIELAKLQTEANKAQDTIKESIKTYQADLDALQMPESNVPSLKNAAKTGLKWAILGFVAGAVLLYCFFCAVFLMSRKVYSGACLSEFCGIRVLGYAANEDRKRGRIDRWLRKLEGRIPENSAANDTLLAANVKNYCPASGKLLVTGDAGDDQIRQIAELLKEKLGSIAVIQEGGLLRDAKAVEALAQCDAVVLVECCGVSDYGRVSSQIRTVTSLGKDLIGCILYD